MSQYPKITHVIFDVDGLLLDTESLYTEMMKAMAEPYGKTFTWDVKLKMMGRKEHEAAQVYIDELGIDITVEEYLNQLHSLMVDFFPRAKLMPGTERLVKHLHKHNVPMALATGGEEEFFGIKTKNHQEIFRLFRHAVFSSEDPDVKKGKPAPDCFLVANNRFENTPDPANVLVFEDAPNGVEAGLSAGMPVIWVPDENVDRSVLKSTPTQTLSSLVDFQPQLYGLPAFES